MSHPTTTRSPLLYTLLLLSLDASAQALRDSGYGDGSLVDRSGNYYYPQPDGHYLDAYGSSFAPLDDGVTYADAIGNQIDIGTSLPFGSATSSTDTKPVPRPRDTSAAAAGPALDTPDGVRDLDASAAGDMALPQDGTVSTLRGDTAGGDLSEPPVNNDFGSMYLEDMGDGYLSHDEATSAGGLDADGSPRDTSASAGIGLASGEGSAQAGASDWVQSVRPATRTDDNPQILKPVERRVDDAAAFKDAATARPFSIR